MNTKKLRQSWNKFPITSHWRIWASIPFIIIAAAIIAFGCYAGKYNSFDSGINIGIDFKGGTVITTQLGEDIVDNQYNEYYDIINGAIGSDEIADKVIAYAAENGLSDDLTVDIVKPVVNYTQTSGTGAEKAIVFKIDNISSKFDTDENTLTQYRNELILEEIADKINEYNPDLHIYVNEDITSEYIGASASSKLLQLAFIALGVTVVVILIYIIIRFEIWSGLAAVIALIHDVIIMVCVTIILRVQVNAAFVSAVITIVAYSINNTIVIFDRVRENNKNAKKINAVIPVRQLADDSIRETTLRNFNSTITTLVMILLFAIIGTSSVREFAIPVISGLIAGFYSSMFLSPSLYILMREGNDRRKAKREASGVIKVKKGAKVKSAAPIQK